MMENAVQTSKLRGARTVLARGDESYPRAFGEVRCPPERLYVVGDPAVLGENSIAIVGARRATPYGRACAARFADIAAGHGIVVVSGGGRGCDTAAHKATLEAGGKTVVVLGGGCDRLYPTENARLFQQIVDAGGAVVSEHPFDCDPRPYMFRARNRLIAALGHAVLIVEAGLPSGTFSTADEALALGHDVLAVPGNITAATSRGANRLIYQGATPIVDDKAFSDALLSAFGALAGKAAEDARREHEIDMLKAVAGKDHGESENESTPVEKGEKSAEHGDPELWRGRSCLEDEEHVWGMWADDELDELVAEPTQAGAESAMLTSTIAEACRRRGGKA